MSTTVVITEALPFALKRSRVYISPTLKAPDWQPIDWLECTKLQEVAGPDIDHAEFRMLVGDFAYRDDISHSSTTPLTNDTITFEDLNRQYCRVEIANDDDSAAKTWYGVFEADARDTSVNEESEVETGEQRLVAYGLLRELERTFVRQSKVKDFSGGGYTTINRGLPFNYVERAGGYVLRGNFATGDEKAFSNEPWSDVKWTATAALIYLFENYSPKGAGGAEHCEWTYDGEVLNWYDISVETDRRSLKEIVDELIDRRRLAGYRVEGYVDGGNVKAKLIGFTFTQTDITEGADTIPANTDLVELDCGDENVIEVRQLRNDVSQIADKIRVEGQPITTTFSLEWDALDKGWTSTQETDYLAAGGAGDEEANSLARSRDAWKDVFARFLVKFDWDLKARGGGFVVIDPEDLPDAIENTDVEGLFDSASATVGTIWFRGKRFLDYTAIKDDDSDEFIHPFVLFPNGGDQYVFAEQASTGDRQFSCHVYVLRDALGIKLHVNKAAGQSLLAKNHWATANAAEDDLDPEDADNLAFDYEDMIITVTIEWDDRTFAEKTVGTPVAHERTQLIRVPDARLDFELKGTVTDIDDAGELVESAGKVLRDDRARLRTIAAAAAEWYGVERNALTIAYKSVTPFVTIGQLVTALIDGDLDPIEVNTPITGVVYDFTKGVASIETSYAAVEFGGRP